MEERAVCLNGEKIKAVSIDSDHVIVEVSTNFLIILTRFFNTNTNTPE